MRFESCFLSVPLAAGLVLLALSPSALAQQPVSLVIAVPAGEPPDAPRLQFAVDSPERAEQQQPASAEPAPANQGQSAQQPAPGSTPAQTAPQTSPAQGDSNSQAGAAQSTAEKSQREKGEEEVKEQEHQRVEGVVPTFNVTYHHDAVPLAPGQKIELSFRSAVDPFAFASAFMSSGYHEAENDLKGFPWGPKGYFERTGVAYLDTFDSTIFSTGIFPIVFRQDPRYFRMGQGTIKHRILYSLSTNFVAKNDYNGKWGPNMGNLLGNFAAGEISQFYYPAGNSGTGLALTGAVIQIAEGAGGSIFNEFWPDLSRRFLHKDPTHGLDALARAQDAEEKAARNAARQTQQLQQNQPQQSPE